MSQTNPPIPEDAPPPGYLEQTRNPLPSLLFLLPWIALYEVGTFANGTSSTPVVARNFVQTFLDMFGVAGRYLPGLAVVVVLMAWHVTGRYPWRFKGLWYMGMLVEAFALTVPLVVFSMLVGSGLAALDAGRGPFLGIPESVVMFIGVGIYEELVFRLLLIAVLHMVFVDVIRMSEKHGAILCVIVSSFVFALAHFQPDGKMGVIGFVVSGPFVFYLGAGIYLASVYLMRGFGIVAVVHALYDISTMLPSGQPS